METPEEYFKLTPSTGLINESRKMADNIYSQVKLIISRMEDMHNTFIVNRDKLEEYVQLRIKEAQKQGQVEPVVMPESNGQVKYAIKHKDKFMLMQVSNSEKQLNEKIEQAYWLAHGMQPKNSNYTKEDFMKDMEKVKVTFEKIG